ncbi:MAG: hypothetical protein ACRD0U_06035 [Acidimicrobiales bacterium]
MSVALLFAACGGDDDDGAGTTTTTTERETTTTTERETTTTSSTTPTTAPPATPEQQAIAVYDRYWTVLFAAGAIPDPDYPALAEVATGGHLARAQDTIERFVNEGLRGEGRVVTSNALVESATDQEIILRDCLVMENSKLRADTGEVIESGTATFSYRITVVPDAGVWKVEEIFNEEASCVPG